MQFGAVLLLHLALISITQSSAQFPLFSCRNDTVLASNSTTFNSNLNTLFSSLVSAAATPSGYFHNSTAGNGGPNSVHGLYFCRGDITLIQCRNCISNVIPTLLQNCSRSTSAEIWDDFCTLRYSTSPNLVSTLSLEPNFTLWNSQDMVDSDRFDRVWTQAMVDLKNEIVNGTALRSGGEYPYGKVRLFGTKTTAFTPLQTILSLAQCSPDLSESDCDKCLNASIAQLPSCCFGKQGGRVLKPSCNIRSEIYPFYTFPVVNLAPSPAPSPPDVAQIQPPVTASGGDGGGGMSTWVIVAIAVPLGLGAVVGVFCVCYCCLCRRGRKKSGAGNEDGEDMMDAESLQYSFDAIRSATGNFSEENKIGEGGFGDVYLGLLSNGTQIAVKRLSQYSGQGVREFKNEVLLVAKLQHRNLVRLLGFCLEGSERILIYDFIQNRSLDCFLFDPEKQKLLDWSTRYKIINGIARGMLYLHEDSPLKIIHRDLKASNVLLDEDMNPKIADFGTAKIVGMDESQSNTNSIIGTFGYMPPEYAMHGHYSAKSDVYSFGVLVLEIISGKKNGNFYQSDEVADLLSYAWKLWTAENPLKLLDPCLVDKHSRTEVSKCIHMALLCVQEDVSHRPTTQTVMLMLNSMSMTMPQPQTPIFFLWGGSQISSSPTKQMHVV